MNLITFLLQFRNWEQVSLNYPDIINKNIYLKRSFIKLDKAELEKPVYPHIFRCSYIRTTEINTNIDRSLLHQVHKEYHPRCK